MLLSQSPTTRSHIAWTNDEQNVDLSITDLPPKASREELEARAKELNQ